MTWTTSDRWTCPTCDGTEVFHVHGEDLHRARRAAQKKHARRHASTRDLQAQIDEAVASHG
jgi:hypothetical protein